jgi:plasmid replication initiation protein
MKFELDEFIKLRSTYAKQMYRLLKQWRTVGQKEWPVQDLRYLLAVPKNYRTCDIDSRVLKPIIKELSPIFRDLKVKAIKKRTKGNPIIAYQFKWMPELINEWIEGQPQPNPNKPKKQKEIKSVELDEKFYPQAEERWTIKIISNCLKQNLSLEDIASLTEISVEEVKQYIKDNHLDEK